MSTVGTNDKVLIVKSNLEPFRVPFFHGLQRRLAEGGIALQVAVPSSRCGNYQFEGLLPVPGFEIPIAGKSLCWQGVARHATQADLVIVQQNACELTNYLLLALRRVSCFKLALWGHGTEFQSSWVTPVTMFLKEHLFRSVDFWFAYTPGVASIVAKTGFPRQRICTVYNSIDTEGESEFHRAVTEDKKEALRAELGMAPGARLACYCGSLYKAKHLDFLIAACTRVRASGIDLHLAVLGEGAERQRLEAANPKTMNWLHFMAATYGQRKATLLAVSECMVIPGVVGLAVVDAFVHECPLVTTEISGHGPEIEYLVHGVNGLKVANRVNSLSEAIAAVFYDRSLSDRLRRGCREAGSQLTLANMVEQFASGVVTALHLPPNYRRSCVRNDTPRLA